MMERKEKSLLMEEFKNLKEGMKLLIISGEEGIGKTYLVKDFCDSVKDEAICYYEAIKEVPEFVTSSVLINMVNYFKKLIPSSRLALINIIGSKGAQDQENLISLLSLISTIKSVVLIFDDFENCTSGFLNFIPYMLRAFKNNRIMIIILYNPIKIKSNFNEFLVKLDEFNSEISKDININPLTFDETVIFIDELGYRLPVYVKTRVYEESRGNPKSITLMLSKLMKDGLIDDDKYWVGTFSKMPEIRLPSYRTYLYTIYNNLSDIEKRVITSASVTGMKFTIDELKNLENMSEEELVNILEKLIKYNIIGELDEKTFEFKKREYQTTLYEKELMSVRKRFLHRKLAEYYERTCSCPERIGLNYYYANVFDKARVFLENAAELAMINNDFRSALNYLEKLINKSEKTEIKDLILAGDCHFKLGNFNDAVNFYDRAISNIYNFGQGKKLDIFTELLIKKADVYANMGDFNESRKVIYDARNYVNPNNKNSMFHINRILGYIYKREFQLEESERNYLIAYEISKALENDSYTALINKELGTIYYYKGDFMKASEYFRKALIIYEKLKDYDGLARCYNNLGLIEINNNFENVMNMYNTALNYADISGNTYLVTLLHSNLSQIYFWAGMVRDAEKEINVGEHLSELKGEFNIRYDIFAFRADLKTIKGNFIDALLYLDQAINVTKKRGSEFYEYLYELKKLEVLAITGKKIDEGEIEKVMANISRVGSETSLLYVLPYVGLIHLYSGRIEKALEIFLKSYNEGEKKLQFLELIVTLGNIPMAYLLMGKIEKFVEYYNILKEKSKKLKIEVLYLHIYRPVYNYIQKSEPSFNDDEKFLLENGLLHMLLKMYISYYHINPNKDLKSKIFKLAEKLNISVNIV